MDGEFEKIKKHRVAEMAEINCTAKNEHVAEIERKIREVKERTRGTTSGQQPTQTYMEIESSTAATATTGKHYMC